MASSPQQEKVPWFVRLRPKTSVPAEWREEVLKFPYYAPSCFTYCCLGAVVWIYRHDLPLKLPSLVPWRYMALLLLAQGPASYLADVYSLARDSWLHASDSVLAALLVAFFAEVMAFGLDHGTLRGLVQEVVSLGTFVMGLSAFRMSQKARTGKQRSPSLFALWHSVWHLIFPMGSILVVLVSVHWQGNEPVQRSASVRAMGALCIAGFGLTWAIFNTITKRAKSARSATEHQD